MNLTKVISAISPLRVLGANQGREVNYLLTDSRELYHEAQETLFFALRTSKRDAAQFVGPLYEQGVRMFVVGEESLPQLCATDKTNAAEMQCLAAMPDATILVVSDVLQALQDLAAYKRSLFHGTVIGITGSNGKTVVKEWLYQLLRQDYRIVRSPKSYNSQIGVPLSVWMLQEDTELAIFEAGISQPGEMKKLERIIRPTIGVMTFIGPEHGENFVSVEQKRAEKMLLFEQADTIVEDPTHQNVRTCAGVMRALGYDEETISQRILQQTHETVLEVNLSAMIDNVRHFRSLLKPETKLTCMVKAFAYGAGSVEVSQALQKSGLVDYLAVAVADEGVELRRAGITLPIIIMDPEAAALDLILENNLQPNVYSFESLQLIQQAAEAKGLDNYPVHVKIDSGMHRLGFYREQIETLAEQLRGQHALRVQSVFSHLAGSDEPQFDDFTLGQIAYFSDCAEALQSGLGYRMIRHICNSAGIERFSDYQFEMCRLGIGLYGQSFAGAQLRNVCSLRTTILSLKTVRAGETIGYGRHTRLDEDRQIAVIPIGYADGFDRRFSNYGGEVVVRGTRCPIVGNVCMDQAMVDVTGVDAQVGDSVEIFGDRLPLQLLADKLQTITYEILTSVSRRVQRVYFYE